MTYKRLDLVALTDELLPPSVTNVTISPSNMNHAPHSFDTVAGSGSQLRTVPVGAADTIEIEFSEHVTNIGSGSLSLYGLRSDATLTPSGFSYSGGVGTWTFSAAFPADQYVLRLADSVTDADSNALDGEWVNPFSVDTTSTAGVSTFPSGNDVAGGDFNFVFTILPGDANLDNLVNGNDFLVWQQSLGSPRTFTQADFNGDGVTDGTDLAIRNAHSGLNYRELAFADFDGNGQVDGNDYLILNGNIGTGTTHAEGDADLDGDVDGDDFDIWSDQFGLSLDWVA